MEKVFLLRSDIVIRIAIIYGLVFAPVLLSANCGECHLCQEEIVEGADYELFEEYEKAFERFEIESEQEEIEGVQQKGFIRKWCKKLKKWFSKKIYKIFKKMAGIKKIKNSEDCAYTIAKFKRKMDKKFRKHITIDEMFHKFDEHTDNARYPNMIKFKERIKFYHENKHERPPEHHQESFDNNSKDLEKFPLKATIGAVGIFCGAVIMAIPLPGCWKLGSYIAESGFTMILWAYVDPLIEDKKPEEQTNP